MYCTNSDTCEKCVEDSVYEAEWKNIGRRKPRFKWHYSVEAPANMWVGNHVTRRWWGLPIADLSGALHKPSLLTWKDIT